MRAGNWDPDHHDADRQSRDALAARGYWPAFHIVQANLGEVIAGASPGHLVRTAHRDWYRELFQPGVRAVLGHWLFGYVHPFPTATDAWRDS